MGGTVASADGVGRCESPFRNDVVCTNGQLPAGAVTIWLVNAATSGAGRSLKVSVCEELTRSVTGARAAIEVAGRCRGTTRGRLSTGSRAGSKAVSCSRELNSCLTSTSEKSWVTAFDGFGRAFRGSAGTER